MFSGLTISYITVRKRNSNKKIVNSDNSDDKRQIKNSDNKILMLIVIKNSGTRIISKV